MLKPLKDRVLAIREEAKDKTASGFYLGDQKEKPTTAKVEAVGSEVKEIKKGDRIVYREYSASEMKVEGKEYLIVKEEDVLATL